MTGNLSTAETTRVAWEPDASLLDAARDIAPIIREHSEEAERERRLSAPVLTALKEAGLLRMTTPRSLGGLETDPVTRALVGEEVGRHDSAAGWTLENPLDWAVFCCRLPDEGAEEIYRDGPDVLIAAQFGRPLSATSADGGYRISGRAPFLSNCHDADWISSTVLVDEDSAEGEPEMRMVYFPREGCEILDTWNVMGMRGTGSHDISVTDVYVPKSRTFPMEPEFEPGSHYRGPLYRMPVVGTAAAGIPTPMLGVARRALDEVLELARSKTPVASGGLLKQRASAQNQLGRAEAILRSGRLLLLDTLSRAWQRCLDGEPHSLEQKSGPAARNGSCHERRRPGGGARLQHRGNDGVSSHQPAGTLLPGRPDDATSRVRVRAALWDLRPGVSRGRTGLPRDRLLGFPCGSGHDTAADQPERARRVRASATASWTAVSMT